jgi:hypothetical protein
MLPVYDIDREFRFIEANKRDYTKLFMSVILTAMAVFLIVKYIGKKEKSRQQFYM